MKRQTATVNASALTEEESQVPDDSSQVKAIRILYWVYIHAQLNECLSGAEQAIDSDR